MEYLQYLNLLLVIKLFISMLSKGHALAPPRIEPFSSKLNSRGRGRDMVQIEERIDDGDPLFLSGCSPEDKMCNFLNNKRSPLKMDTFYSNIFSFDDVSKRSKKHYAFKKRKEQNGIRKREVIYAVGPGGTAVASSNSGTSAVAIAGSSGFSRSVLPFHGMGPGNFDPFAFVKMMMNKNNRI